VPLQRTIERKKDIQVLRERTGVIPAQSTIYNLQSEIHNPAGGRDMQEDNKRRKGNWSSAIGWLIFILVIAGGPLLNLARGALGGAVNLPPNLLPMLIGGLVLLSLLISVARSLGGTRRSRSDTRLPTDATPPYGGPATPRTPPPSPRAFTMPAGSRQPALPSPPRFDPVVNPKVLALGIVGIVVLAGAALLIYALALP
jgi:hypothetical protein